MIILVSLAALGAAVPVTDTAPRWIAGASFGVESFTRDRAAWRQYQATLGYRHRGVTVIGELIRTDRFARADEALAATTYLRVDRRTSGWARLQVAPRADVIARLDASAELERALGGGWTVAGGYRRMSFAESGVDLLGASVNRYLGPWLLQARGQAVMSGGRTGAGGRLMARRSFEDDPDRLLELAAGVGQEVVLLGAGLPAEVRGTGSLVARGRWRFGDRWGAEGLVTWSQERAVPDRTGFNAGIFARW
ncbi:MAG: YaiO family outer membrane beta-barrel protein [Gemmatimonadales bacterium]